MTLLSTQEAERYWNRRHLAAGDLRSGGHVGLSEAENEAFYITRLATLVELIGMYNEETAPLHLLDAGCGRGYFADAMSHMGHRVTGIDVSPAAVDICRATRRGTFQVARLHDFRWSYPFDVVYSIDVLFHILDEPLWAASLASIATAVRAGGMLVVTDVVTSEPGPRGNYIVARDGPAYEAVLRPLGFVRIGAPIPYGFGDNPNGFYTFRRLD